MAEILTWYTWDSLWKSINLWARDIAFRADYIHRILDTHVVQRWDKVVEFWSWQGHKSKTLLRAMPGIDYTWVELFPEMIAKARKKLPFAHFTQWDMTNPEDIPDDINVAFYLQSLHHLDLDGRWKAAQVIYDKLPVNGKIVIVDSFVPEVQNAIHAAVYRAYAVLAQHPWNKFSQSYHAVRSFKRPDEYDPADFWYYSPRKTDILWESQSEMFKLLHDITPFWGKAISDTMIFEKIPTTWKDS